MSIIYWVWVTFLGMYFWLIPVQKVFSQDTQILGFVAGESSYEDGKLDFAIGEQVLFIRSQLNDRFSFIGESVFKFSENSDTDFSVSVERILLAYNYKGNHNILYGKHHTPINYWNDAYHHGRVFFPTIFRPLLFDADFIPIHTTGLAFQGLNLGSLGFGYNLMIGNGLGSTDVDDNDKTKSITASLSIKPEKWYFGTHFYRDEVEAGASEHGRIIENKTTQHMLTATIAHFGQKFELLTESSVALNDVDGFGQSASYASYLYAGVRLNDNIVPYLRYDNLEYDSNEQFFESDDTNSIVAGIRYEISYLVVLKMEYQFVDREIAGNSDMLNAQIAIGF